MKAVAAQKPAITRTPTTRIAATARMNDAPIARALCGNGRCDRERLQHFWLYASIGLFGGTEQASVRAFSAVALKNTASEATGPLFPYSEIKGAKTSWRS